MLDGKLSLTTPEGVRLLLTPAGPATRAKAWLIDFLIWCVFAYVLILLLGKSKLGEGILLVLLFLVYWGYPVICEVYFGGRTIGKQMVGIEVLRADGLPVGWRESSLRNLLLVADFMPMMYATGLLCMLFDAQFRRLGDIVARTQVVYRDAPQKQITPMNIEPLPLPFPLSPEQQRMLIDLLEREKGLPPARLEELATLAEPLTGCTGKTSLGRLRAYVAGLTA